MLSIVLDAHCCTRAGQRRPQRARHTTGTPPARATVEARPTPPRTRARRETHAAPSVYDCVRLTHLHALDLRPHYPAVEEHSPNFHSRQRARRRLRADELRLALQGFDGDALQPDGFRLLLNRRLRRQESGNNRQDQDETAPETGEAAAIGQGEEEEDATR